MCFFSTNSCFLLAFLVFQSSETDQSKLIRLAQEAKQTQVTVDTARGVKLRQDLLNSIQSLKWTVYIEPQQGSNWDFQSLLSEIVAEATSGSPNPARLNQLAKEFYGSRKCLIHPKFLEVRNHLRNFVYWIRTAENKSDYQQVYESHLSRLIQELENHPGNPDLAEIAASFNWLAHSGHATDLVAEFRQQFSHPAVMIDVNPNMGKQGIQQFEQNVDQTQYTSNLIAGAQVEGNSQLTGTFRAELLDDTEKATVRVYLQDGLIRTQDSVGRSEIPFLNGTVFVHGSATTYVDQAYVDLYFDGKKIVCSDPVVECRTQSNIKSISVDRKGLFPKMRMMRQNLGLGPDLIDQMIHSQAMKVSQNKKSQAEWESANIAAENLSRSIKAEITKQLAEVGSQIENEITDVLEPNLIKHGIYFDQIVSQSSPHRLRVAFDKKGIGGLGSPQPKVAHNKQMNSSLELMIHESSFLNFFTELSSGARWNDTTWAYLQRTITGLNSYSFLIGTRERWSCDMDWDAPISFRFQDDKITFCFRIRNFNLSGDDHPFPFCVSATYRPSIEHYGIDLVRDGGVQVEWLDKVPEDDKFRAFVQETFEDFLQEKQHWDSLIIPYGGPWGEMDKLRFESFTMRNGWFVAKVSPNKFEKSTFFANDSK